MRLGKLLTQQGFHIDLFVFDLKAEDFVRVINVLVDEWVFEHLASAKSDKQVPCHVISKVGHDDSSATGLINRSTVDL